MRQSRGPGLDVSIHLGGPADKHGIEVDVGSSVPFAFGGLRSLISALQVITPNAVLPLRAAHGPEWNTLFPESPVRGRNLFDIADAPNQRRLFRESEQVFRVLNVAAHVLVDGIGSLGKPLILRNVGACDLVSLRGIMHAVQCSRLTDIRGKIVLGDWEAAAAYASHRYADTRREQLVLASRRMRAHVHGSPAPTSVKTSSPELTLEGLYLTQAVEPSGSIEYRLAAALLAIRACFFSTNHEGAMLAAETGLALLDVAGHRIDEPALISAWEALDDPRFDVPMLELDRSNLGGVAHLRALFLLHIGMVHVFTGFARDGRDVFGRALDGAIAPEFAADLRLYRALVTTKMLGDIDWAQAEVARGIAVLNGRPRQTAATHEAWLRNLEALTYFQQNDLEAAQRAEELSLECIDRVTGPSATHLKTNLVSNFSVLYEAKGDLSMATKIWQSFAALNAKLGSDAADKVFLNRLGALQREAGAIDAALESYKGAFHKAETTGDIFHAETIAGAIARVLLDRGGAGNRQQAAHWYELAAARARACGDCLQWAKNLAGNTIAENGADFSKARDALTRDVTYDAQTPVFDFALATGDAQVVVRDLPRGKSKLSRPFTLVNL